jgi:16S rRNA (guanine527-N7)-methyltransferase
MCAAQPKPNHSKSDLSKPDKARRDQAEALKSELFSNAALERLRIYEALLRKWQSKINLVAGSTLEELWTRHFIDSAQVQEAAPEARIWADLGSGGGFPGLVTAILLTDAPGARVHLIESDQRKCAFLREVSRETSAPAEIHCGRIETVLPQIPDPIEAISARALAPLAQLVTYAEMALDKGAIGVFPKGQNWQVELTDSSLERKYWINLKPSRTDPAAQIIIVRARGTEDRS